MTGLITLRNGGLGGIIVLAMAGCEPGFQFSNSGRTGDDNDAWLRVEPTEHDFGQLTSKDDGLVTFTVTNDGFSRLMIDELSLDGDEAFAIAPSTQLPVMIDPYETWTFDAMFQPTAGGDLEASVSLWSTDEQDEVTLVPLKGSGALPRLEITPDPMDFRTFSVPCVKNDVFTLKNVGVEPLRIDGVSLGGANPAGLTLLSTIPSGLELSQNQAFDLRVELPAEGQANVVGELLVDSTDPRGPLSADILATTRYIDDGVTTYSVPPQIPIHFVFAVDQSGSMNDDQTRLANNFSAFITTLSSANADFRIGVVTGAGSPYGDCFNGNGWLTPSTPDLVSAFTTRVQQGNDSSLNTEALMALVDGALGVRMNNGQCNAGFTTGNGPLHVILVSDERDQSASQNVGGYLTAWRSRAGAGQRLAVHAVVDIDVGDNDCGGGSGYDGPGIYDDAVFQSGGFLFDLCNTGNWASALAQIAQSALVDRKSVEIDDRNPHAPSIEVYINGVQQTSGWTYNSSKNAVDFDTDLPHGSSIEIRYGIAPSCP